MEYRFVVTEESENTRIDSTLSFLLPDKSRSYIQKIIKDGAILVNGKGVKQSYTLKADDEIVCNIPEAKELEVEPENMDLDIVYEDSDIIIINKPKDMVVHPAPGHMSGTLVNGILYHCKDLSGINGVLRPGIVHRIDKDTTGLLIICKNDNSHNSIAAQLKEHSAERTYHAICHGVLKDDEGVIDAPLGRSANDRKKMAIVPGGKRAVTHYTVLERFKNATYVKLNLETGRTHQIRVHMASLGHPLLGDPVYGRGDDKYLRFGQLLHAKTLGVVHPSTGEFIQFDSSLPEYFMEILEKLKK